MLPKYPIYIISKGRFENCLTAKFLIEDNVDFKIVIEPQEQKEYSDRFGEHRILVLPFSNLGLGSIPARNWVWEHSKLSGAERHWILDDNIRDVCRRYKARRIRCNANIAFRCIEDFTNRYENIGISGMNYSMFIPDRQKIPPFWHNVHVYSCLLIQNDLSVRWRGRYNEDTDLCLQVLAENLCTVLVNAFTVDKMPTMKMKGGNMTELYQGDGRLRMARSLERVWPGVVTVDRRFKRPQHVVKDSWRQFTTPLKLKPEIDLNKIQANDYGLKLQQLKEIKSPRIKALLNDAE